MDPEALARLTESERNVLRMLAEGHTAKSIAGTLDLSINAVNERLREARRKTGSSSSRELARVLKSQEIGNTPQEIGDKQIGVPRIDGTTAGTITPGTAILVRRMSYRKVLAMILLAAAAIGALSLAMPSMQTPQPDDQPAARRSFFVRDGVISHTSPLDAMEKTIQDQAVDPSWAPQAEQTLQSLYGSVDALTVGTSHCATSLCAVSGTSSLGGPETMAAVTKPNFAKQMRDAGFQMTASKLKFARNAGDGAGSFTFFVRRQS